MAIPIGAKPLISLKFPVEFTLDDYNNIMQSTLRITANSEIL